MSGNRANSTANQAPVETEIRSDVVIWANGTLAAKFSRHLSYPLAQTGTFAAAIQAWKRNLGIETGIKDSEESCWVIRPMSEKPDDVVVLLRDAFARWGIKLHIHVSRRTNEMDWPEWRLS